MASEEDSLGTDLETTENGETSSYANKLRADYSAPNMDMSNGFSPLLDVSGHYQLDVSQLRIQMKQTKLDLQSEQDMVSQLRKRLNIAEKDRLEATSQANTEITSLESQLAKVRAQIEKGEATRHNLEYELTKARREVHRYKNSIMEREAVFMETNDELKQRIRDLTDELRKLQKHANDSKLNSEDTERKLKHEIDEKNQLIAQYQVESEAVKTERDKLNSLTLHHQSSLFDLRERIQELETEQNVQADNLRRTLSEVDYAKEREERLKQDLEVSLQRIKSLEEAIEAERAAHLETKFNSEIVQLRVRDLEGGMEVEKSANVETNKAIERLTKQLRELEQVYDDERKVKKEAVQKLDKMEKEYVTVRRQLMTEVENKKNTIGNLSKELEIHQKNFNELKDELGKAKKRQIFLEETYGGSMRELDLLLRNFQLEDKTRKQKPRKDESKPKKPPSPAVMLEILRQVLQEYKKKLETSAEEGTKWKKQSDKLAKELDTCKDMIQAKDKALEDAQKNYTRTAKELNRVRSETGELEGILARLKIDLQSTSSNQDKDRNRIQGLSEEIMKLVKRHRTEDEEKIAFLHGMYQRLLAGRIVVPAKEKGLNQFSWTELSEAVYQQVVSLISSLQQADDKMQNMEEALQSRDTSIEQMQRSHEEQLNKLTSLTKERENSWKKQKEEIEAHYNHLLMDLQSRSKKSQTIADQAWEKIRATGSVQHGLEAECSELRKQLLNQEDQNSSLLAACALLTGALYPLYARSNELAAERRILEEQMIIWDICRERAQYLVSVLNSELREEVEKPERDRRKPEKKNPYLRFRMGVIAVLAANRLQHLGRGCSKMFVTYDTISGNNGLLVCTGGIKQSKRIFQGISSDPDDEIEDETNRAGEVNMLEWMSSPALVDIVMSSMNEFQEVACQVRDKGPVETRALLGAARSSFSKLMEKLGPQFPNISLQPMVSLRERTSLVRSLSRSLRRTLTGKSVEDKQYLASSQDLMIALQNHILDFTQRLHQVEVERRDLVMELGNLKEQIQGTEPTERSPEKKQELIRDTGEQSMKYVTMEKFEKVCHELNNALHREQQAQQLLHEQSRQVEEITLRLDMCATQGMDKEHTLSEAVQGLSEAKTELRRREQSIRQLNKQLMQQEMERKSMHENLADAESALRTAAKDKEILAKYIKSVEGALQEAKRQMSLLKEPGRQEMALSKLLLNADFIPADVGKAGPELIACQNLVGAFIDVQHQGVTKIKALEDEIESHRQHVATMKRELSDAVHREYNDRPGIPSPDEFEIIPSISEQDIPSKDSFVPLKEDSEISYSISKPVSPVKSVPGSAQKSGRSPRYQTPSRSQHTLYKQSAR